MEARKKKGMIYDVALDTIKGDANYQGVMMVRDAMHYFSCP